jgi:hypothetical protein
MKMRYLAAFTLAMSVIAAPALTASSAQPPLSTSVTASESLSSSHCTGVKYTYRGDNRFNYCTLGNGTLSQIVRNRGNHEAEHVVSYSRDYGTGCGTFRLYSRATFASGTRNSRHLVTKKVCYPSGATEEIVRGPSTNYYRLQGVLTNYDGSRKWVTPSIYVY